MRKLLGFLIPALLLLALAGCGATSESAFPGTGSGDGPTSEAILDGPTAEPGTGESPNIASLDADIPPTQTVEMLDYVDEPLNLSAGDTIRLKVAEGIVEVTFDGVNMDEPARFTGENIRVVDREFKFRFEYGHNALEKNFPASTLMLGDTPLAMVVYHLGGEKTDQLIGVTLYLHKEVTQE